MVFPVVSAALCALVSLLVLIGWAGDFETLKAVVPGWVSMKPNTALGLLLCAGALGFSLPARAFARWTARGLSLLVVALGSLSLAQYLFAFDAGIDQALFADTVRLLQTSHPGRMAPSTALCFLFLGLGIFLFSLTRPARLRLPIVKAFAATTAMVGLFSLMGYAADSVSGAQGWVYTGVAAHTALGLLLLGSGLLAAARREECYARFLDFPTTAGFLVGILLMLLAAQMAFNHTILMLQSGSRIAHRQEVLKEIRDLAAAVAALESTQRGYLILGTDAVLEERTSLHGNVRESLREIQTLTADTPHQSARRNRLESLLDEQHLWQEHTIETRRAEGPGAAARLLAEDRGVTLRHNVLALLRDMEQAEHNLLASDKAAAETAATTTFLLLPLGVFLSLSVLLCGMFFLNAGLRERDRSEHERLAAYERHAIELGRINRLYAALSQVNQSIVRTANREDLFEKICRVLVEQGGFPMVWVGWEDAATRQLRVAASCGDRSGYLKDVVIATDDRPEGRGPTGSAFRENSATVCNDIFQDPNTLPWRENAKRCGYRSTAAFPIHLKGRAAGVLTVYAADPDYFQAEEIALLKEVTGDVSFALDTFLLAEEHRIAESRARQEQSFSEAMIESMPGIVYFYDEKRRFLRWNRNFASVSGYSDDEIRTLHPLDFFPSAEKSLLEQKIATVFATGEDFVEASFLSKDGHTTPYLFTGRRMIYNGTPCLVGMGVDISERKKAQAELLALNKTLEHRVAARTVELESVNRELESFCYSVSHDLRAPLRGIAGFTHILQETCEASLDDTSRGYFQRILTATSRMGELIDDLLKLSRVNREEFRQEDVPLSELAAAVAADLRQNHPDQIVELTITPNLHARGDARLLRIVLENLLGNAWKFTSKTASPRITLGSQKADAGTAFFVRDNGAGFDMRYAGKLFGPFQRLHRLTEFPGTGIGLATVQRIIHRHGGRVWAEAAVGQGATFYFTTETT